MIGPFPNPIHGMSLANQYIFDFLNRNEDFEVSAYDTNLEKQIKCKSRQGRFEFAFALKSLFNLLGCIFFLLRKIGSIAYITPPQSALGLFRYSPIILLSILLNEKTLLHIHGSRIVENIKNSAWPIRTLCKLIMQKSSTIIALSPSIAAHIANNLALNNVKVCMNGIAVPDIKTLDLSEKYIQAPLRILFLSNLMQEKGIFELLEAVAQLNDNGLHLHLDIAGAIEPSINACLSKVLQEYPNCFTYHGIVQGETKIKLLRESAIFCLPSYDEGIPLSILEAYAYGCIVIATNVGGIPDIFCEKENGYLCIPRDVKTLVLALSTAEKNFQQLNKIGRRNALQAQQYYSLSNFENNIRQLLTL